MDRISTMALQQKSLPPSVPIGKLGGRFIVAIPAPAGMLAFALTGFLGLPGTAPVGSSDLFF